MNKFINLDGISNQEIGACNIIQKPMAVRESDSALRRWQNKPVIESILLDDMEDMSQWTHKGYGQIMLTEERSMSGKRSLRLISPTKGKEQIRMMQRQFGNAAAQRNFEKADWTAYNRLSFWVYPVLPGFRIISMKFRIHNDGQAIPGEGVNYQQLKPEQWNHVVWEIPHVKRDKVTAVEFIYLLVGNEPEGANEVYFDIDLLELQKVEADKYEGWDITPGKIAYSHTGYMTGFEKKAFANLADLKEFKLINEESGEIVLRKAVGSVKSSIGEYQVMDFSEADYCGTYYLQAGNIITRSFKISSSVWNDTIKKSINFFYSQRCGMEIPNIHGVCHKDWRALHNDQSIVINGGWHDAGDLSQGLTNTAEAVYSMFALSESIEKDDPALAGRLTEEARWGLDWVLKTRFEDGYRVKFAITEMRSDGIIGTVDDITVKAADDIPLEYFHAACAEAIAGRRLLYEDPVLANYAIRTAVEDWNKALEKMGNPGLEIAAAGVQASIELYKVTGEVKYSDKAIELSKVILNSQQLELPEWDIPLTGFFYTGPDKKYVLHYNHRSHEQAPIVALADMCRLFSHHADWVKWYSSIIFYSEYLKAVSKFSDPYGMLPCSIYNVKEAEDMDFVRSQTTKITEDTLSTYREQIKNGIELGSGNYLRMFPAATSNQRGNFGVLLSQTKGLAAAARILNNEELMNLVQKQLQWVVGMNPFSQSMMYGEGYDYVPQFTMSSGDIVGSLPVGIQTSGDKDVPFWTGSNYPTYKEVWVHPSSRWMWIMKEAQGPAQVTGCLALSSHGPIDFRSITSGKIETIRADWETGEFSASLSPGTYEVYVGKKFIRKVSLLPGSKTRLDLRNWLDFSVNSSPADDGNTIITIAARGKGTVSFELRVFNLETDVKEITVKLDENNESNIYAKVRTVSAGKPWVAVIIPNGDIIEKKEVFGRF